MSEDADYRLALEIQRRINGEESDDDVKVTGFKSPNVVTKQKLQMVPKRSNPRSNLDEEYLNRTQNLVHPMWETLDPTPDVRALFGAFDDKFFQSRLKCVTLEWSKRMYSCAGICYSSKNRFGMSITIRLSEPLLKLRPRKDLVETLLHEMIHAYCFVLHIREGNGGHGPQFKKIMVAINKVAGTNITVYHTFHDEVNLYKQHWWRCNGSCQHRSPFFGYVKRTSNRAPGPNDQWWAAHQESCGGTFMKIKEPEKKRKTKKDDKPKSAPPNSNDIRKFFNTNDGNKVDKPGKPNAGAIGGFKGPVKTNGGGTLLLNPRTKPTPTSSIAKAFPPTSYPGLSTDPFNTIPNSTSSIAKAFPPTSYPGLSTDPFNISAPKNNSNTAKATGGNLRNVVSFGDLGKDTGPTATAKPTPTFDLTGRGHTIGSAQETSSPTLTNGTVDRDHLRGIWSKRFGGADKTDSDKEDSNESSSKRRRLSSDTTIQSAVSSTWQQIDDDVMLRDEPLQTFTLSSDEETDDIDNDTYAVEDDARPAKPLTAAERQNAIKKEIMDETADLCDDDIVLIDDEFDDNLDDNFTAATELADTTVIDEFFGDDTLLKDFLLENDVRPTFSRHVADPQNDIVTCPVCQNKLKRNELEEHLNGCTGIAVKVLLPKHKIKKVATNTREVKPKRKPPHQSKKEILRAAGYSEEDLINISASSTEDEFDLSAIGIPNTTSSPTSPEPTQLNDSSRSERMRSVYKTTRQCPVCAQEIEESYMNDHLDICLL